MKTASLIAVLLLFLGSSRSQMNTPATARNLAGAWVTSDLDWEQSAFHQHERWTSARVLYFFRDGRFGIVGGTIYQTDNRLEISYGDSQTVYFGSWKRTGDKITIAYKVVYRDIEIQGETKEMQQGMLAVNEDGEVVFQSVRFRKEPRLDKSAASTISEKLPRR